MKSSGTTSAGSREESEEERLDRNLGELLQELRVALPGVQILFAFLLAVPFQGRFAEVTPFQRTTYFATLLLTAVSAALLIAPTSFHRVTFRLQLKAKLVPLANRFTIAGLGTLGLAMTGAVLLITDFLYGTVTAALATSFVFGLIFFLWVYLPTTNRFR